MQPSLIKQKLATGDSVVGTFVFEFNTTGMARLADAAGAEFVIYDMEHTGWSVETIRGLVAATRGVKVAPYVRVPATEYYFIARVLDTGATGIMAPMVETAEQARRLVQSAKYPPVGRRGAAFNIAHDDYRGGNLVEKMQSANRETLIIAQIETATGLENVEAIAAVEGIDVLWLGQFDMSNFLGVAGQLDHPRCVEASARIVAAAQAHGKSAGIMVLDVAEGRTRLATGYRMVAYSGDLWIYQAALRQGIAALRA